MELEPRGAERRTPVIGHRSTDREAVAADRHRFVILPPFEGALDGPDAAHFLLQAHLGVAVRLEDRLGRLAQIMKLAQLVRHTGEDGRHGRADRLLSIGDDPADRHGQGLLDRAEQRRQIALRPAQEAARQQDLPGQTVAQHPQHLVPDVRLQAIQREDDLALLRETRPQAGLVGQPQRDQFFIPLELVRHSALGNLHAPRQQQLMDLGHAAVLGVAQGPDQRDDIQAELPVRQGPAALLLRAVGAAVQRARRILAAPDDEGEPIQAIERHDRAPIMVRDVGGSATFGTASL